MISDLDNESTQTLSEKVINWLHQAIYFTEYNKNLYEAVIKWLKIKNKGRINEKIEK